MLRAWSPSILDKSSSKNFLLAVKMSFLSSLETSWIFIVQSRHGIEVKLYLANSDGEGILHGNLKPNFLICVIFTSHATQSNVNKNYAVSQYNTRDLLIGAKIPRRNVCRNLGSGAFCVYDHNQRQLIEKVIQPS